MDEIKIGLDFGTHQTKICVQRIPDEGRGEPNYEFFQFTDLKGSKQYFLPSVIQINDDDSGRGHQKYNPGMGEPEGCREQYCFGKYRCAEADHQSDKYAEQDPLKACQ